MFSLCIWRNEHVENVYSLMRTYGTSTLTMKPVMVIYTFIINVYSNMTHTTCYVILIVI
ncbi:unnamed protein product, partial [Brassica oleracea var. botrytis]